jgi:predicted O-methyltransferase YrrM
MHDAVQSLEAAYPEPHPLLLELEQHRRKEDVGGVPRAVGRLLSMLVHAMQANRILEIGTAYGYATLWMALAQPPIGKIWTFDPDAERTEIAHGYFARAGEDDHIEIINQPALEVLGVFPQHNLDLIFIDAPPADYSAYAQQCVGLLKLSGLLIFNGVLRTGSPSGFAREFLRHPALDATILPVGEGLALGARTQ